MSALEMMEEEEDRIRDQNRTWIKHRHTKTARKQVEQKKKRQIKKKWEERMKGIASAKGS